MVFGLPAVVLLCKAFIILSVSVSVAAVIRRAAETGTRRRQTPSSSTGNRYRTITQRVNVFHVCFSSKLLFKFRAARQSVRANGDSSLGPDFNKRKNLNTEKRRRRAATTCISCSSLYSDARLNRHISAPPNFSSSRFSLSPVPRGIIRSPLLPLLFTLPLLHLLLLFSPIVLPLSITPTPPKAVEGGGWSRRREYGWSERGINGWL